MHDYAGWRPWEDLRLVYYPNSGEIEVSKIAKFIKVNSNAEYHITPMYTININVLLLQCDLQVTSKKVTKD